MRAYTYDGNKLVAGITPDALIACGGNYRYPHGKKLIILPPPEGPAINRSRYWTFNVHDRHVVRGHSSAGSAFVLIRAKGNDIRGKFGSMNTLRGKKPRWVVGGYEDTQRSEAWYDGLLLVPSETILVIPRGDHSDVLFCTDGRLGLMKWRSFVDNFVIQPPREHTV